jgi:glycosyltransferase involved in cell wall biosynthesis
MMQTTNPTAISVLIRTFNSEKTLGRVLFGIELAEGEEYIVVDSGSTDSTLSIAAAHGARIIHAKGPFNYSKSLNLGFQAAQNPWVLVISSHSVPVTPGFIEVFRSAGLAFPPDVVVGYGPNTLNGRGTYSDDQVRYYDRETHQAIRAMCGNGNTLYRRSAWELVPFDENIRTSEDKAWLAAILDRGYRIAFVPGARTINLTQYSLRYMFMKGYSDRRADGGGPMGLWGLFLSLGSHTKKCLQGGVPFGNWLRYCAHIAGQFFASYRDQDNTPGKDR